jgi:hypothetical protein
MQLPVSARPLFLAIVTLALVFAACGGKHYATDKNDDEYDLEAMELRNADLPDGILLSQGDTFDNKDWAQVVGADDPDVTEKALDRQGRLRGHVAFYTWENPVEHLGRIISVTAQSTLFVDEAAASDSLTGHNNGDGLCGLLIDKKDFPEEFTVPSIGDQAIGLRVVQDQQNFGKSVDTVICFRTGRIVHGIQQSGLEGTEDVAQAVKLAQSMLKRIDNALAGKADPLDEPAAQEGG